MIDYHTYCAIRELRKDGRVSVRKTARLLHIHRETAKKYGGMEHYKISNRPEPTNLLDIFKRKILEELALTQSSASTIFKGLQDQGYQGGYSTVKRFVASNRRAFATEGPVLHGRWILMLLQGAVTPEKIMQELSGKLPEDDIRLLLRTARDGDLRERNYALSILTHFRGISIRKIAKFLIVNRLTVTQAIARYVNGGVAALFTERKYSILPKHEQTEYKDALFKILHSPPRNYGINRTTWTMKALHHVMAEEGFSLIMSSMRLILKKAGFRFKKAKKVLTSTDPAYREKLEAITAILSQLSPKERFFSIDEFGPVAVKVRGGIALVGPGEEHAVPQIQKVKGQVLLVGALELSTNQITHFYSNNKSTTEMIQLLHILLADYAGFERIYLSWDSASWHNSKRFLAEVDRVNNVEFRSASGTPEVVLAPLPSCAQFLNVIESVFSGMARAIIHNSDYNSVNECKSYIDRYLRERNEHYLTYPKRAGNKIWGQEREIPMFSLSNNCKDPMF